MPYSVLIVEQCAPVLARLAEPLRGAGYDVIAAKTFEVAKERLENWRPDLMIVASRLGSFNGLHLVIRARDEHPQMAAIITTAARDPVLEVEASNFGAACVVAPETSAEVLALVSSIFAANSTETPHGDPYTHQVSRLPA